MHNCLGSSNRINTDYFYTPLPLCVKMSGYAGRYVQIKMNEFSSSEFLVEGRWLFDGKQVTGDYCKDTHEKLPDESSGFTRNPSTPWAYSKDFQAGTQMQ